MNVTLWQSISTWAGFGVLVLGVLLVVSGFLNSFADSKLKDFYRKSSEIKLDAMDHRLSQVYQNTELLQPLADLLLPVGEGSEEESEIRKSAFEKYKNEEYLDALTDINQAIELAKKNPKNLLVRAYIYHDLYKNFYTYWHESGPAEKVRKKYSNRWYKQAMDDYEKAIEFAEDKNGEIAIEAQVRIPYLKSERALCSEDKTAKKLFEEAQKSMAALLNRFPDNEKIKSYSKLIKSLSSISEESEDMFQVEIKE